MYNTHTVNKMGQMLSREDEEDVAEEHATEEHAEEHVERLPRQRKRNVAALRSRKVKTSAQGRTRRNRANAFNDK